MKQYKYNLDKSSKKFVCPKCNKRTLVKYKETETGNYLNEDFGRCDRETNCGFYSTPTGEFKNTFEVVNIPKPKPSFHNYDLVSQSGRNYKENNFVQFLKTIFTETEVKEAILRYLIGTSKRWNGATIFWQIDNLQRVHAGKILQYVTKTGKRYKNEDGKSLIDWVHSILKRNQTINDFNLNQCLFGLHLINESNAKTIALVEGEKTAIMMSIFKPQYIWLATGSKQGFKYENLKPIKQYKIIAFPDKGEYEDWFKKATELNILGFDIIVNDWLENTNFEAGTDFADVLLIEKNEAEKIKKYETIYTNTEHIINEFETHTPEIWNLIKTFGLVDCNWNEIRKVI